MKTKICSKCKIEKSIIEFHKSSSWCKLCKHKDRQLKREANQGKHKEKERLYYETNKDRILLNQKKYNDKNRELINSKRKIYYRNNKDIIILKNNLYKRNRQKIDPLFDFSIRIRRNMGRYFNRSHHKKESSTKDILGCSFEFFKTYLESKFKKGMTWENRSEWHLDHIIPISSAKTKEELIKLNHHTNFQPLWKEENMEKRVKIIEGYQIPIRL